MKIRCLLIMPGKEAQVMKIPANLKFIKAFVGENLYKIRLEANTYIFANNNAPISEFNRIWKDDIILGNFIIVSTKKKRLVSLKRKLVRKYTNIFKLRKHQKKIEFYKDECLEEYYLKQRAIKQKNAEENRKKIFGIAA